MLVHCRGRGGGERRRGPLRVPSVLVTSGTLSPKHLPVSFLAGALRPASLAFLTCLGNRTPCGCLPSSSLLPPYCSASSRSRSFKIADAFRPRHFCHPFAKTPPCVSAPPAPTNYGLSDLHAACFSIKLSVRCQASAEASA